jgi:hypothetical protein
MKISWAYIILAVYLAFVGGILFLVFKANGEKYDLVTENYYEAEVKYQNVIDQKQRVANLSTQPEITYNGTDVQVVFPSEFAGKVVQGEIYLYCPSNAQKDLRQAFTVSNNQYTLKLPASISGLYDIKLSWQAGGQTYFLEQKKFF